MATLTPCIITLTDTITNGILRTMETQPQPLGLAYRLPQDTYWVIINELRRSMPKPADSTPEALAHRDNAALANVASMLPANANEATLAAQFVAASAHAGDCMRLAMLHPASIAEGLHCRALSVSMMRQAQSARRLLMRVQAERHKREADPAASEKAAWIEHCAIELIAEALPAVQVVAAKSPPPSPIEKPPAIEPVAISYRDRVRMVRALGKSSPDELMRALSAGRASKPPAGNQATVKHSAA